METSEQESLSREGARVYAAPHVEHVSLGGPIRAILLWIPTIFIFLVATGGSLSGENLGKRVGWLGGAAVVSFLWSQLVGGVRVAAEWEKGVILTLGRYSEVRGSGVFYVLPFIETVRFVDTRVQVINIPRQRAITKDNVPVVIDGALFFSVKKPELAVTKVQDYRFAISQYSQSALRDVVGSYSLDELLSEREKIQEQIAFIVGEKVRDWGLTVESIQLQDFDLPEELKKVMSRQASAEREKRATITKAEGDRLAAENLAKAAKLMAENPIALELRTLQTIDGLANSPSNTVILFPMELGNALKSIGQLAQTQSTPQRGEES
ncbi:MAG: SPFH domain-containing protein [Geminocystis sp.]|nr:SPFH domain-containing protein [Geminocystis sp.]HIK38547.1 slipin family protein [Geminocystis sp. M7585_C2015_104]MCS7147364.1 SPFH domain-containing protein [Geminocystis sp.]MCX8079054.1 SPFH domain-containing protein [Geminocystis sp.]MDW8116363.1 SPFH domain-containing protein [Geminocystis sp.]